MRLSGSSARSCSSVVPCASQAHPRCEALLSHVSHQFCHLDSRSCVQTPPCSGQFVGRVGIILCKKQTHLGGDPRHGVLGLGSHSSEIPSPAAVYTSAECEHHGLTEHMEHTQSAQCKTTRRTQNNTMIIQHTPQPSPTRTVQTCGPKGRGRERSFEADRALGWVISRAVWIGVDLAERDIDMCHCGQTTTNGSGLLTI